MPKTSKRKVAVTQKLSGPSSSSTPQSSRAVIRSFHTLLKQQARLQAQPSTSENTKLLNDISQELDSLGGLETYQQMSAIGQGNDRGGGSEKVFISWLKELQWPDLKGKGKHRLLEVGALKPDNYDHCRAWLEVTPIDLHSRHPQIMEQDFLKMDVAENAEKWDAISLSLVVNFVPVAIDRGRMLTLAHTMLAVDGLLFLALPLPCVMNSRYTTPEHISSLMVRVGFEKLQERWKSGGKMIYWLFRKVNPMHGAEGYQRKSVLRRGNRNNFAILL